MGVGEKLLFASGISSFLKGGGGAAGSRNTSIIPWITLGTYYHPGQGQLVTYDKTNGIRCLAKEEYFVGKVLGCPADSNVSGESDDCLYLGETQKQTLNAYTTESWHNADIGPGSTLTIASGVIRFGSGPASIGSGKPADAGTIDFGPAEGIIWTGFDTPYGPNCIGSVIAGSGGLTTAGNNVLVLKAANTYTGKTCVGSGILQVGDGTLTTSRLGNGDVDVAAGGALCIKARVANAIADAATVSLGNTGDVFYGMMNLENGISETVGSLVLGGVSQPAGTYGSSASAATHKLDTYFSGPGILTVAWQKGATRPSDR
jgi:autotransporter-associated beta strand protein